MTGGHHSVTAIISAPAQDEYFSGLIPACSHRKSGPGGLHKFQSTDAKGLCVLINPSHLFRG